MHDTQDDFRDPILSDTNDISPMEGASDPADSAAQNSSPNAHKRSQVRTLADLARIAGVSAGTVSRALAGKSLVNVETRERIQKLAREYGFRPNQIASKLRSQRTGVLGVVIPLVQHKQRTISDPFFLTLLGYLARYVTDAGYDLMLCRAVPDGTTEWLERVTASGMVDGVLVIGQSDQFEIIENVAQHYHPMVVWGHHRDGQSHCVIGSDHLEGGRMQMRHLIETGARRIAFLGDAEELEVAARLQGAQEVAQEQSISLVHHPISFVHKKMGDELASVLNSTDGHYDGLICASDLIAMTAQRLITEKGLMVPDDVQIIGYDDLPLASQIMPALTTLRQEIAQGAQLMVDTLKKRIEQQATQSVIMPPRLVARASTRASEVVSELL